MDDKAPTFARLGEKATLTVEAIGNVFDCRSQALLIEGTSLPRIHWEGQGNCYSGMFYGVWEKQPDESVILKEQGLAAWNKLWKSPERESREVELLALEWGRMQRLELHKKLPELRNAIQKLQAASGLKDVGPDWDLVGPGDAYVRALAAEGRGVPAAELRPEQLDGGPFTLIHDGKPVRGYPTLLAAIDAASDKDAVEIRTDGPVQNAFWSGEARLLTIRAAAGYTPIIEGSLGNFGSDWLILEGLTLRSEVKASGQYGRWEGDNLRWDYRGSILRLMNCELSAGVSGWMFPQEKLVPEIVNSHCSSFYLALPAKGEARFRNSVFAWGFANTESRNTERGTLDIDRCVFWQPEHLPLIITPSQLIFESPMDFHSSHSIFVSAGQLIQAHNGKTKWQGTANIFAKASGYYVGSGLLDLEAFQSQYKTDADSVELPPWEFDPAQMALTMVPTSTDSSKPSER